MYQAYWTTPSAYRSSIRCWKQKRQLEVNNVSQAISFHINIKNLVSTKKKWMNVVTLFSNIEYNFLSPLGWWLFLRSLPSMLRFARSHWFIGRSSQDAYHQFDRSAKNNTVVHISFVCNTNCYINRRPLAQSKTPYLFLCKLFVRTDNVREHMLLPKLNRRKATMQWLNERERRHTLHIVIIWLKPLIIQYILCTQVFISNRTNNRCNACIFSHLLLI